MKRSICNSIADKLFSRGFGRRNGKCIELSWVEFAYLSEKGILNYDFEDVVKEASQEVPNFDILFLVYRDLRDRGYVLKDRGEYFMGRKNYSMAFYPLSDLDYFDVERFIGKEHPFIISIVDFDGEVTYYLVDLVEPEGTYFEIPNEKLNFKIYGKRAFVFSNLQEFESLTYGRNEGSWGHLSLLEIKYLAEKGVVEESMESGDIYKVYKDLRDRGLIVKSGFKYGTHFRVYENSMEEHSRYLVHLIPEKEEIQKISRAVRVAHGVRKTLLLAHNLNGKIVYFSISWIRP